MKRAHRQPSGIALVIVLGFLVLITVLVVAFFASVSTENTTARTYADGASAKFLADSAVNIVEGQIAKATKTKGAGSQRLTWSSQPGMIRTYDDTGAEGDSYKLYSAEKMVTNASAAALMTELKADVPTDWNQRPAIYTDLNTPVKDSKGLLNFPILEGNVKSIKVGTDDVLTYDDDGDGIPDIEGFGLSALSVPNYQSTLPISSINNPVPMPVRWLYILQDGSVATPDSGTGTLATFTGSVNKPAKKNPIVGRVAFWADDETSKLNINTASEGSYYAFPHTNSPMDMQSPSKTGAGFAVSPPATGEYNRYPGHPATTCLSVALGKWLDPTGIMKSAPSAYSTGDSSYLAGLDKYMAMLPRLESGGSKAGTTPPSAAILSDTDRFYASLDELIFKPSREPNPDISNTTLDKLRFFLTANNRCAEVTPFNTPKVSLWPQWSTKVLRDATAGVTAGAKLKSTTSLLAFCSSFGSGSDSPSGKFEYFMQRIDENGWKSSIRDWNNVPRNQSIANYLYKMGNKEIPGYGGTFVSKYPGNAYPSVVVQSLDFVRSNVGKLAYMTKEYSTGVGSVEDYIAPLVVANNFPGATAASPIKGFGDHAVCTEIVLGVAYSPPATAPLLGTPVPFLSFQFFIPTQSYPGSNPSLGVKIEGTANLGIVPQPGKPALPDPLDTANFDFTIGGHRMFGWYENKTSTLRVYPWALEGYTWNDSDPTVNLGTGGPVTFSFYDKEGNTFQKIVVNFPQVKIPKPTATNNTIIDNKGNDINANPYNVHYRLPQHVFEDAAKASARGVALSASGLLKGDARLLGALYNAGSTAFAPANATKYSDTSASQSHTLRVYTKQSTQPIRVNYAPAGASAPTSLLGGSLVSALKNTDYLDFNAPIVPYGLTAALNSTGRPGDWDTGPGLMPDGPYVNPTEQRDNVGLAQYFDENNPGNAVAAAFSPNRLVASAVKFGSLPTGADANNPKPWQTLLFCPNPASRTTAASSAPTIADHPGFGTPPDHVYLEFFTMPTVEPYAVSEPLSTMGKVNLNYQLAPFTNIERSTALRGVLKNTMLTAICPNDARDPSPGDPASATSTSATVRYKYPNTSTTSLRYDKELRYNINRDATLAGLKQHYFEQGKIFRYASEVCDLFLVPERLEGAAYVGTVPPTTYDGMMSWWRATLGADRTKMNLTGDNLREEPYDRIYPRLTTKSNTYTVHYRVQTLRKRGTSDQAVWEEGKDTVTAEYRGSSVVERYVDPNDPALNAAWDSDTINLKLDDKADLGRLYKFRVVSAKKFAL